MFSFRSMVGEIAAPAISTKKTYVLGRNSLGHTRRYENVNATLTQHVTQEQPEQPEAAKSGQEPRKPA